MPKKEKKRILFPETKQWIWGFLVILFSVIIVLSFFDKAGIAGEWFMTAGLYIIGRTIYLLPLFFVLIGIIFLKNKIKQDNSIFLSALLGFLFLVLGFSGIMHGFDYNGGILGRFINWPLSIFGETAPKIIFIFFLIIGFLIFKPFFRFIKPFKENSSGFSDDPETIKQSVVRKIFKPKFNKKEIDPEKEEKKGIKEKELEPIKLEEKKTNGRSIFSAYNSPPLDLLEKEKDVPGGGDIKANSAIIKNTLQTFNIEVVMSEVNVGPTVTQYTLKPVEGVKLSKITGLANDLALALASHPIRIEAPIPGRSLVGIEIPNTIRAQVRLRNLIETPNFQRLPFNLTLAFGKDVSGFPVYADLAKTPHMLVAGSTGSGKTIFLNNLILSLLYQPTNSFKNAGPESLRLILVDPKRVEFPVYQNIPHLLCPIIYNAHQTINALKWLIKEMERRFEVLAEAKVRNINGFNEYALKKGKEPLPFIVLIIDELADLMAARGKDIEALIVRLAQMSRAVGVHLVLATQRPSVEVITGLIKANITSRVTFQVASQVDSRTVIDTSGAEKLLGRGDMFYISSEYSKPKRIQAAYISEKEISRVIDYIVTKNEKTTGGEIEQDLLKELEKPVQEEAAYYSSSNGDEEDDPLYEEAKEVVVEAKKASASLLQRRLKVGYARAARLIDMMEERGVVGPADGAKAREIYINNNQEDDSWEKV